MIVHYKTERYLKRLLDALGDDPRVYVSVWDNSYSDNEILWPATHPAVNSWKASHNIGYSKAINQLSLGPRTPVLAALNADVDMTSDDAVALAEALLENDDIAVVGPKQRDSAGKIRHAGIFGEDALNDPEMRGWGILDRGDALYRDVRDDAVTLSGSAYFMKRSVWDEITHHPGHIKAHKELVGTTAWTPEANEGIKATTDDIVAHDPEVTLYKTNPVGAFLETEHYYEETYFSSFARHLGYKLQYRGDVSITHEWRASGAIESSVVSKSRKMFVDACEIIGMSP